MSYSAFSQRAISTSSGVKSAGSCGALPAPSLGVPIRSYSAMRWLPQCHFQVFPRPPEARINGMFAETRLSGDVFGALQAEVAEIDELPVQFGQVRQGQMESGVLFAALDDRI